MIDLGIATAYGYALSKGYTGTEEQFAILMADLASPVERARWYADVASNHTKEKIDRWLDDHPEATTTVQDGSLTEAKLSSALALKTVKDYVTPEMFGAVGDNQNDDSIAVQNAINTGKNVLFTKTYKTNGFTMKRNQHIVNYGIIYLQSPITFVAIESNGNLDGALNSSFTGGVVVADDTPAFVLNSDQFPIRRFHIKDVIIVGSYNENCCAIKASNYDPNNYVTFCTIDNINIYGCHTGLGGAIRASNISLIIEQCYYPVKINSDLNNICVTGQAMNAQTAGNTVILDITGNENNISGTFYDVHSPNQDVFCYLRDSSTGNKLNYDYRVLNTVCDNYSFVPYYGYGTHDSTTLMNKNVLNSTNVTTENIKDFNLSNFLSDSLDGVSLIKRIDETQPGIIDVALPPFRSFFGFKAVFYFWNYAPTYFEVYKDDVLIDRKQRVLGDNGIVEWYPKSYETGYSNLRSTYRVRFIIESDVRLFQINFFRA